MRSARPCRLSSTALAVWVSATLAVTTGFAAEPPEAPPTFGATTELVTVDVLVVDASGRPVRDLAREDFHVYEDGVPQRISSFEAVEARLPSQAAPQRIPSESRVASNLSVPPTRRTFGIVFDDLHLDQLQVGRVQSALRTFLARETRAGDRLVLLTTAEGRFWTTTQGTGSTSFDEAIDRLTTRRRPSQLMPERRMSPVEAMRIMQGDRTVADRVRRRRAILSGWCVWRGGRCECSNPSLANSHADACDEPPGVESAEEAYSLAVQGTERALAVLRDAIAMLGAQRDRKVLVLVSQGFMMDASLAGFQQVRDAAARANVVLYFLDAGGLEGVSFAFGASGTAALPPDDLGPMLTDWRQEADGARTLAAETGGLSLRTNDLVAGLQRVADESQVAYLLGYEPPNPGRDGRYHTLKVEVLRRGLQVRARAGYFAPRGERTEPPRMQDPVQRAARDPFDHGDIPLRLATYLQGPSQQQKGYVDVVVAGELRQSGLQSRLEDGLQVAEPRLVLLVSGGGRELQKAEWRITVRDAAPQPAGSTLADGWYPFATSIPLEPGDRRIRLVVESGDRIGSVTQDLVVPEVGEVRLSTPILSDQLLDDAQRRRVMPLAHRVFPRTATLHCWVELYGAANEKATGVPLVSASFVARSAEGREWAAGPVGAMDAEAADPARFVSIPLAEAPEGENEVLLRVRDEISGRVHEAREPFRVETRGASSAR